MKAETLKIREIDPSLCADMEKRPLSDDLLFQETCDSNISFICVNTHCQERSGYLFQWLCSSYLVGVPGRLERGRLLPYTYLR